MFNGLEIRDREPKDYKFYNRCSNTTTKIHILECQKEDNHINYQSTVFEQIASKTNEVVNDTSNINSILLLMRIMI